MKTGCPEVLIIRGAPGVGKSSLAGRLKKWLKNSVLIEIDQLRGMISSVEWCNDEQHFLSLNNAFSLTRNFLTSGYHPIIIVDTFSRGKLTKFLQNLTGLKSHILSLYAQEEELLQRINDGKDRYKEIESCLILNEEILKKRYDNEKFIDTTNLSKEAVFEQVKKFIIELTEE